MDRPRALHVLLDQIDHLHRCRRTELELLVQRTQPYWRGPILELGSGDGLQGSLLAERFGRVIGTEIETSRFGRKFPLVQTTVEKLPFRDRSFATVFSSSVLEHVVDLQSALREMQRVLVPGGSMIHILPTRFWISVTLGLRFPYMLARRAYRALHGGHAKDPAWQKWWYAGHDIRWDNIFSAPVHGISSSHREEWYAFSHAAWAGHFRRAGLEIVDVVNLYAYTPYGFLAGAERLRSAVARLGFATVRAYVVRACTSPGALRRSAP